MFMRDAHAYICMNRYRTAIERLDSLMRYCVRQGRGVPVMVSPDYDNDAWDGFFKGW